MLDLEGQREDFRSQVAAAHRTAMLLFAGFAASIGVYLAVALIISNRARPETMPTEVPVPFYVAAVFLALGAIVFRRTQMHRFRLEAIALRRGIEGLIKHFAFVTIISAALAEIIGVMALLVVFLGGDGMDAIRLAVVALAITLYSYPRRGAWQHAVDFFSATTPGIIR